MVMGMGKEMATATVKATARASNLRVGKSKAGMFVWTKTDDGVRLSLGRGDEIAQDVELDGERAHRLTLDFDFEGRPRREAIEILLDDDQRLVVLGADGQEGRHQFDIPAGPSSLRLTS